MRTIYLILAAIAMVGCSNTESGSVDEKVTSESLLGTWVVKMIDSEEVYTNEQFVCKYNSDGSEEYLALVNDGEGSLTISYTNDTKYSVSDGVIYMTSGIVELQFPATISSGTLCGETGEILRYSEDVNIQEGVDENQNRIFSAIRTTAELSSSIIGLWEGVVIDGDHSEPFDNIRLYFKSENRFNFYKKESSDSDWVLLEQDNTYYILGTLLATQWDEDDNTTTAEIWETTIDGDDMTWRATREGVDYEMGFDLVRVSE